MPDVVLWFRRDLRLADHAALGAATRSAGDGRVLPLFVIDPVVWRAAAPIRRAWLIRSLRSLSMATDGALVVRCGEPTQVVSQLVNEIAAAQVHVTADAGPYGRRRDVRVGEALGEQELVRTGSPYAVAPGTVVTKSANPYRMFTAYFRAWLDHVEVPTASQQSNPHWMRGVDSEAVPDEPQWVGPALPPTGEGAAHQRLAQFLESALCDYDTNRDRPDLDATSGLSSHLKFGEIHPFTALRAISRHDCMGAKSFKRQIAWRDFLADVTWHLPHTTHDYYRSEFAKMRYDQPGQDFNAWRDGRTGYPIVDAAMRQLKACGWMHNRMRMVVASFLVKDLHIEWTHGARHFMRSLHDGDLANNQHGWQWVAGCGVDSAPFFRVFNPVLQGLKFDPHGDYVRRWIPELTHVPGSDVHQPWRLPADAAPDYPNRIVDHDDERRESLRRLAEMRRLLPSGSRQQ